MSVYFLTIAMCIFVLITNTQKSNTIIIFGQNKTKKIGIDVQNFSLFILTLWMILLIGLRSVSVGIDTYGYSIYYPKYSNTKFNIVDLLSINEDTGYVLLCRIVGGYLHFSWNAFCLLSASIYIIPVIVLIKKYSPNIAFSLLIFALSVYFTFPMSTIRQSLAIGITLLAYFEFKNKKIIPSILWILLASTFHKSALIFLLFLIVIPLKLTDKKIVIWFVCLLIIDVLGFPLLRRLFSGVLRMTGRNYTETTGTGGYLTELFYILTILLSYVVFYGRNDLLQRYQDSLKALLLSASILPIVSFHSALFRSYYYFSIFEIVLVPQIIKGIKGYKLKLFVGILYVFAYIYLFITQSLSIKGIVPYSFFWQ